MYKEPESITDNNNRDKQHLLVSAIKINFVGEQREGTDKFDKLLLRSISSKSYYLAINSNMENSRITVSIPEDRIVQNPFQSKCQNNGAESYFLTPLEPCHYPYEMKLPTISHHSHLHLGRL